MESESINVTIRMDKEIKREFEIFCDNVGINITTAFNMFVKATLRTRELPFVVTDVGMQKQTEDDIGTSDEVCEDPALKSAIEIAVDAGQISTSFLQRKLSLGYGRAVRLIDTMEKMNIIGPFNGAKWRKVLITREEFIEMFES